MKHLPNTIFAEKLGAFVKLLFSVPLILLISCQNEETVLQNQDETELSEVLNLSEIPVPEISNFGYLVFEEPDDVNKYHTAAMNAKTEDRRRYETSIGFSSMQTVYEDFENWSEESIEKGYGVSDEELKTMYQGTLIFDEEWDYDYDLSFEGFSVLVNRGGWIRVGDTLFGYPKDKQIKIVNPTARKMQQAKTLDQSNLSQEIFIEMNDKKGLNQMTKARCTSWGPQGFGRTLTLSDYTWGYQDRGRSGGSHEWRQQFIFSQKYYASNVRAGFYEYDSYVKLKYRKRGFLGRWYATRPEAFAVTGSQTLLTSDGNSFGAFFEHEDNSPSIWDKTWTEKFITNGSNGQANLPFIDHSLPEPSFDYFNGACWDFTISVDFEHDDRNNTVVTHIQSV